MCVNWMDSVYETRCHCYLDVQKLNFNFHYHLSKTIRNVRVVLQKKLLLFITREV